MDDNIDAKKILSVLSPEVGKTARTSLNYVVEDRTEWPEIPRPQTDWGTWYGSEPLTMKATFGATHSNGASQ